MALLPAHRAKIDAMPLAQRIAELARRLAIAQRIGNRAEAAELSAMLTAARTEQMAAHIRPRQSEAEIQRAIVAALQMALPFGSVVHHSANEIRDDSAWARRQQGLRAGMGVVKGFADLIVLTQGRDGRPLTVLLEVKTETGRPSREQMDFAVRVENLGHHYSVVRSIDEALDALAQAGAILRASTGARPAFTTVRGARR